MKMDPEDGVLSKVVFFQSDQNKPHIDKNMLIKKEKMADKIIKTKNNVIKLEQ